MLNSVALLFVVNNFKKNNYTKQGAKQTHTQWGLWSKNHNCVKLCFSLEMSIYNRFGKLKR